MLKNHFDEEKAPPEELHIFPNKENTKKHQLNADCPCDPLKTFSYEAEAENDNEFQEVTLFIHQRAH
jgi:hypothetical protein